MGVHGQNMPSPGVDPLSMICLGSWGEVATLKNSRFTWKKEMRGMGAGWVINSDFTRHLLINVDSKKVYIKNMKEEKKICKEKQNSL